MRHRIDLIELMELQYWDAIPVHRELILLPNIVGTKRSPDE